MLLKNGTVAAALLLAASPLAAAGFEEVAAPTVVAPAATHDWSGPYAGGFVGLGYSTTETEDYWCWWACDAPGSDGFIGQLGGTVGYNQQRSNFVYGVEADIAVSSGTENTVDGSTYYIEYATEARFVGTLRGRAGLAVDETLFFVSGGIGFGDFEHREEAGDDDEIYDVAVSDENGIGFAAGAGVEHMIGDNLSVKAEYLFMATPQVHGCWRPDEDEDCYYPDDDTDGVYFRNEMHTIRLGVNYHF